MRNGKKVEKNIGAGWRRVRGNFLSDDCLRRSSSVRSAAEETKGRVVEGGGAFSFRIGATAVNLDKAALGTAADYGGALEFGSRPARVS